MIVSPEKIFKLYQNKYKAINIAAVEARKLKDHQINGLLEAQVNPVFEALRKLLSGKIDYTES
jgi:DNA-directed RNA polymerase subunit K/omega